MGLVKLLESPAGKKRYWPHNTDWLRVANDGDDGGDGYVEFRIEFIENIAERHK